MKLLSAVVFVFSCQAFGSNQILNAPKVNVGDLGSLASQSATVELERTSATPETVDVLVSFEYLHRYCKLRQNYSKHQFVCFQWAKKTLRANEEVVSLNFKKAHPLAEGQTETIQLKFENETYSASVDAIIASEYAYEVDKGLFNSFKLIFSEVK